MDEARKLKIPVIGVVDTNCDPDQVDFPIPGNDDALRAIRLFASRIADGVIEGRSLRESAQPEVVEDEERNKRVVAAPGRSPEPARAGSRSGSDHTRVGVVRAVVRQRRPGRSRPAFVMYIRRGAAPATRGARLRRPARLDGNTRPQLQRKARTWQSRPRW